MLIIVKAGDILVYGHFFVAESFKISFRALFVLNGVMTQTVTSFWMANITERRKAFVVN